jgi:hypothetical protein
MCIRDRSTGRNVALSQVEGLLKKNAESANARQTATGMQGAAVVAGAVAAIPEPRVKAAAATAAGVIIGAAELTRQSQRLYLTYTMTNPSTGRVYVGRASGFGSPTEVLDRRYSTPPVLKQFGFGRPQIDRTIMGYPGGYYAIRGREQQLIDHRGGIGSRNVANAVRGVAKANPLGRAFHEFSNMAFGPLAPYTGY